MQEVLMAGASKAGDLTAALDEYRPHRQAFLRKLGLGASNRDPLAEFSEQLVAALMDGDLARSRVQANYDLVTPSHENVQVRYLANSGPAWVNEHLVHRIEGVDWYALVLFEAFMVVAVLAFPPDLTAICTALGKRHSRQDQTLQFTHRNYWSIREAPDRFRGLGMRVYLPPFV